MRLTVIIGMICAGSLLLISHTSLHSVQDQRPNIIWIIPDDMSANFSCYGETAIETPHVDALAARGMQFNNAYVTAPVCSPCRSAFITGMYQTTIGAHHHRSGRGVKKISLPEDVPLVPKLFQDAGYYTTLSGWPIQGNRIGKSDYNFAWDTSIYDGNDWKGRNDGQPFFAQIQSRGGKLRGAHPASWDKVCQDALDQFGNNVSQSVVELPPYYPDHPDIMRDWQAYLESVRLTDQMVGDIVARLEEEGELNNTLILFMTDHGISHARGKQFLYDEGIHVPLIIAGPGIDPGSIRDDLVEHIDIAALSLAYVGIALPEKMQGRNILGEQYQQREAVFAARDRCDETVDYLRSVRTQDYKYIRNFLPRRPHLQPNAYKDAKAILMALRTYEQADRLSEVQKLLFREVRPPEELYHLPSDPHEITNLADDPKYADKLVEMRKRLDQWMEDTKDLGPESKEMYDSDMAVYRDRLKGRFPERLKILEANIAQMEAWARDGK